MMAKIAHGITHAIQLAMTESQIPCKRFLMFRLINKENGLAFTHRRPGG